MTPIVLILLDIFLAAVLAIMVGVKYGLIAFAVVLGLTAIIAFIGSRFRMARQMLVMFHGVVLVLACVAFYKIHDIQNMIAMQSNVPHPTVSAIKVEFKDWQPQLEAVGSLRAAKGVDITGELAGIVEEIHFNSGSDVKEGDLLVRLRVEDDIAKLASLEAAAKLAEINYARDKKQIKVQAISQASVDTDAAQLTSARAQAAEQKAVVDKKIIRAPFTGHLGIRNIDVGQYLNPGTAIVTLQQLNPVYLDFYLPQQALAQVQAGQKIQAHSDTYPGRTFEGTITAINPKVDTNTRNIQIRAEIPNPDHALLPGMYATASISAGTVTHTLTLPQTAITYNPYGNTVFLLEDKGKDDKGAPQLAAQQTFVTIGETRGDQVQIIKGVKEGDLVVTSGQIKLQNGTQVVVDNSLAPKNDENPQPKDE
jgi:membrane fusion protein (multidrug efflux system)